MMHSFFTFPLATSSLSMSENPKKIYEARIIYSLTGKDESIRAITDTVPAVQKFICKMSEMAPEQPRLIYGAGMRGKTIQRYWKYNWRAFIDHNPELWNTQEQGLPILSVEEALNKYHNPVVVVTNRVGFSDIEWYPVQTPIYMRNHYGTIL